MGKLNPPTVVLNRSRGRLLPAASDSLMRPTHSSRPARLAHNTQFIEGDDFDVHDNPKLDSAKFRALGWVARLLTRERQAWTRVTTTSPASGHSTSPATSTTRATTSRAPLPATPTSRERDKHHRTQDKIPFLDRHNKHIGDAQASPPCKRNYADDSPIDMAVRRVQKAGLCARVKALESAGAYLSRINQRKIGKEAVRKAVLVHCLDVFQREPFDNIEEMSIGFQLFSMLVQEGVMSGADFVRVAQQLYEEGSYSSCNLLLRLVSEDSRIKLTEEENRQLEDMASRLKL